MKVENREALSIIQGHFQSMDCALPDKLKVSAQNACELIDNILASEDKRETDLREKLTYVMGLLSVVEIYEGDSAAGRTAHAVNYEIMNLI